MSTAADVETVLDWQRRKGLTTMSPLEFNSLTGVLWAAKEWPALKAEIETLREQLRKEHEMRTRVHLLVEYLDAVVTKG